MLSRDFHLKKNFKMKDFFKNISIFKEVAKKLNDKISEEKNLPQLKSKISGKPIHKRYFLSSYYDKFLPCAGNWQLLFLELKKSKFENIERKEPFL